MQKVLNYVATLGRNNLLFLSSLFMNIQSRSEGGLDTMIRWLLQPRQVPYTS